MTSPLSNAAFRVLLVSTTISAIGSFVQEIAERWLILELTGTPAPAASVSSAFTAGSLVAMLPAGVLADRLPRKALIVASMLVQGLIAAAVGALVVLKHVTPGVLIGGAAAIGLGMGVGSPAWGALVSDLLPPELVAEAVVLNAVAFNIARAIGPAIGGVVLDAVGASAAFFVNAATFFVVAVAVVTQNIDRPRSSEPQAPMATAFADSVRHIMGSQPLRSLFASMLLFTVGAAFVYANAAAFAKLTLGAGPRFYGFMFAAMGSGAIASAWLLRRLRDRMAPRTFLGMTMGIFAAATAALAATRNIPLAIALFVPVGIGWTGTFSPLNALMQLAAPRRLRGRVIALYWVLHMGVYALFALVSGHFAEVSDLRLVFGASAGLCGAAALVTSRLPMPNTYSAEAT